MRRGASALARAQVASQIVSVVSLAILLRLLSPQEYGLVAMVVPLLLFLRIFTTLGLQFVTIQRSELTDAEVSAAFWIQLAAGIAVAVLTMALAPFVGALYGKPELARTLFHLTAVLSCTSIVAALGAQPQALLERRLKMRELGRIRVAAQLAGAVGAIFVAWRGAGVWALVVQQYVEMGLITTLCFAASRWRPGIPSEWAGMVRQIQLGGWLAATTIVLFVADNLDRVLVGRLVSASDVGLYSQAYSLMIKPVYLVTTPLTALALASLSRAAAHPSTARQFVEAFYRMIAVALVPVSLGLALVGSDAMLILGGEPWREAGPILSVLSLGLFSQAVVILNGYVLMASGQARACFLASLAVALALLVGYLIGWRIGLQFQQPTLGIACGYAVAISSTALPHTWFCMRVAGHIPLGVFRTWIPALRASVVMALFVAATGWIVSDAKPLPRMVLQIVVGAVAYLLLARGELRWLKKSLHAPRRD